MGESNKLHDFLKQLNQKVTSSVEEKKSSERLPYALAFPPWTPAEFADEHVLEAQLIEE